MPPKKEKTSKKSAKKTKKTKKAKTSSKKKKKQTPSRQIPLLRRALKIALVAGIWIGLFVGGMVAWYAGELPDMIDAPQFERKAAIKITDRNNDPIGRYGELRGMSVNVADLPPHMVYAVIAIEDRRFYQHFGIDLLGIARAMVVNLKAGRVVQGGSTITQQLAKNLFLNHERTLKRKIQEALLALWLEKELTKDEILSAYLNRVYLGSGAYGIDAAAKLYFNKPATDVTVKEAALLAGLLKAPSRYSPHSNPRLARERAEIVLKAMKQAGYIPGGSTDISPYPQTLRPAHKPSNGQTLSYFTDWVIAGLDEFIGASDHDLIVHTTLSAPVQKAAETALINTLDKFGTERGVSQGALIVMAHDGAILAMAGGRNYHESQFNRATQALRPPGSAFKPFVYYTALARGKNKNSRITDAPITKGEYRPQNFKDEYFGEVSYETALAKSLNTAAVRIADDTGIDLVIKTARQMGISVPLAHDLSLALGSSGIPVIEMATAYAMIANGGYRVQPYSILNIQTTDGESLYERMELTPVKPALNPDAVSELQDMLETAVANGTGRAASLKGIRAYGKTGTSQDFRDAWFIGYTDDYVAVVWMGNDDNSPMNGVTGGSLPAQTWSAMMADIYASTPSPIAKPAFPATSPIRSFRNLLDSLIGAH